MTIDRSKVRGNQMMIDKLWALGKQLPANRLPPADVQRDKRSAAQEKRMRRLARNRGEQ